MLTTHAQRSFRGGKASAVLLLLMALLNALAITPTHAATSASACAAGCTVVAWGWNYYGEANVPANLTDITVIAAGGYHTVALKQDGTVVAWGWNDDGQANVPADLSGVSAIGAGRAHTVALKQDGTVVAWGYNGDGQTNVPAGLSGVSAIAAGGGHVAALKQDGTVVAWGYNSHGQTDVPAGLTGVSAIAAGELHMVALKQDGTVVAWGWNHYGQTSVPAGLTGVTAIAAGDFHTLALKQDGTVVAWGYNGDGQTDVPADLSGVSAIAAGVSHTVALKQDGTVVVWGNRNFGYGQKNMPADLSGVSAIAAGRYHTVALISSGTIPRTTSVMVIDPPASVVRGALESDEVVHVFAEQTSFLLPSDVAVDFTAPGTYDAQADLPATQPLIAGGTWMDSYYIHTDQVGDTGSKEFNATITFDRPILGVMVRGATIAGSTSILGAAGTTYPAKGAGLELSSCTGKLDCVEFIAPATLKIRFVTFNVTDSIRVITQGVATVSDTFSGFFQPIDNLPVLNAVNAGSTVPVRFSLGGDQGLAIFASGSPKSQAIDCSSTEPVNEGEETISDGDGSLSYEPSTDTYTYTWKTNKNWDGCRQLIVTLNDGTIHRANFTFH